MTEIIDKSYFEELRNADPVQLCKNGRCSYIAEKGQYSLRVWNDQYLIDPTESTIEQVPETNPHPHEYFYLFVIYHLLRAREIPLQGEWVSEKDLPGGPTFFRGPHQIPTDLISANFGNNLQEFKECCASLGGTPVALADAAFSFSITPDIPLAVLYWIGDEDFPAEAKLLYDRSITELLSLDILFALAVAVCTKISEVAKVKI